MRPDGDDGWRKSDPLSGEPLFCCCEFIDRHGHRSHLGDMSACDGVAMSLLTCTPLPLKRVLADMDDRIRVPMYNGALHVGCEGLLAIGLVPLLCSLAARGPLAAALVFAVLLPTLLIMHRTSLRLRRRSRFFAAWAVLSFVYGNLLFTLRFGEHVPFALWVLSAAMHIGAAACAAEARDPRKRPVYTPVRERSAWADELAAARAPLCEGAADESCSEVPAGSKRTDGEEEEADATSGAGPSGPSGGTRCALCGALVAGYDHHCIWLDTCIGAHNLSAFVRGLLCLAVATGVQAGCCLCLALRAERWGLEAVGAAYAALLCAGVLALLGSLAANLARGLTGHEARRMRREAVPLPPARCARFVQRVRPLLCP